MATRSGQALAEGEGGLTHEVGAHAVLEVGSAVDLHLAALGLSPAQRYTVTDGLGARTLATGVTLVGGVAVPLGAYGTAVLIIH